MTPLQTRIVDMLERQPGRKMSYYELMHALWPPDQHPKAWRYSSNGGPPGCAMSLGRALGQLRRMKLVFESYRKMGRGDVQLLRSREKIQSEAI